jgi:outer membrane protein OmpA-like peptidoglycan-associated protein
MKLYNIILASILIITMEASAQEEKKFIKEAQIATDKVKYDRAIEYYGKALKIKESSFEANAGMGVVLAEYLNRYEEAIPYLEKALRESSSDTISAVYYALGKSYHFIGQYSNALTFYNKLLEFTEIGNPMYLITLKKRIADCQYAMAHMKTDKTILVSNIGKMINTNQPEYVPMLTSNNELIFTSKRKDDRKEKINSWDGKYFESMYISKMENGSFASPRRFTEPDLADRSKFSKFNESNVSVSPSGNTLFIYKGGDLYEVLVQGTDVKVKKMDKNINFARYQNHATLSPDNKTIYFSSESKKGIGGTDLYMSVKNEKGEWSKAVLLDSTINTVFNEDAPFIAEDGTLYFSSEGHPGYGGYDVYKTRFGNGKWSTPENMGQPLNSPGHDIYFNLIGNSKGYISSARVGGYGDMDIYAVNPEKEEPKESKDSIYAFEDNPIEKKINEQPVQPQDSVASTQYLTEKELNKLGWDSSPLYFNYNTYVLNEAAIKVLEKNTEVLKKNKDLSLVIYGYSDSRGPEQYNKDLSKNRALAVKHFFNGKGIGANRIKDTEGFGESGLINNCTDNVSCSENEHQQNRRVEVKIINKNYKPENPLATQK